MATPANAEAQLAQKRAKSKSLHSQFLGHLDTVGSACKVADDDVAPLTEFRVQSRTWVWGAPCFLQAVRETSSDLAAMLLTKITETQQIAGGAESGHVWHLHFKGGDICRHWVKVGLLQVGPQIDAKANELRQAPKPNTFRFPFMLESMLVFWT